MKSKSNNILKICLALVASIICFVACKNEATIAKEDVVGIIGAMDVEVESLMSAMKNVEIFTVTNKEYHIGTIGKTKVIVVKSDMGKVNATICANTLINRYGCNIIINTGVAGSLDKMLKMGDIVISTDAVQHDFDATPIGFKKGEIPYLGKVSFDADKELVEKAYEAATEYNKNIHVYKGRICTGDQFIETKEEKDKITSYYGGLCCDMESGAIAQVCYLNKVPFVILRTVSDVPGETDVEEYKASEGDFSIKCAKTVEYMLENYY